MIVVLTGGTGGAKFVDGLRHVASGRRSHVHREHRRRSRMVGTLCFSRCGLHHLCLAGLLSKERGWGVKGDTFFCLRDHEGARRADLVPRGRS